MNGINCATPVASPRSCLTSCGARPSYHVRSTTLWWLGDNVYLALSSSMRRRLLLVPPIRASPIHTEVILSIINTLLLTRYSLRYSLAACLGDVCYQIISIAAFQAQYMLMDSPHNIILRHVISYNSFSYLLLQLMHCHQFGLYHLLFQRY